MSKQRSARAPTKKHLARAERERIQRNRIIGGTVITALLVIGLLSYGLINLYVIQPGQPIVIIDGEEILTRDFQRRVEMVLSPGIDPQTIGSIILDAMIEEVLIQREAKKLGISVTDEEVERAIQESFGYFPEGTPTRPPTQTPDPTALAEATDTPAPTAGPSPTIEATSTPRPTATPFTLEAYEAELNSRLANLEEQFDLTESGFRKLFEIQLLRQKLVETFEDEVAREQEQTLLSHIVVEDSEIAEEVLERLEAGESWEDLTLEYSTDSLTKDLGGDLGWITQEGLIDRYTLTALTAATQPVGDVVGPIQTSQGWHLFLIREREVRLLLDFDYEQAVQRAFTTWMQGVREASDIVILDDWIERIPSVPDSPG
ncbi:MAG: hypothetical protein GTO14_18460 [Anaerolineales bacterium]|nr:hypothetical protein [Anaerolineales bacterium]